jgi:hypothetical protein
MWKGKDNNKLLCNFIKFLYFFSLYIFFFINFLQLFCHVFFLVKWRTQKKKSLMSFPYLLPVKISYGNFLIFFYWGGKLDDLIFFKLFRWKFLVFLVSHLKISGFSVFAMYLQCFPTFSSRDTPNQCFPSCVSGKINLMLILDQIRDISLYRIIKITINDIISTSLLNFFK